MVERPVEIHTLISTVIASPVFVRIRERFRLLNIRPVGERPVPKRMLKRIPLFFHLGVDCLVKVLADFPERHTSPHSCKLLVAPSFAQELPIRHHTSIGKPHAIVERHVAEAHVARFDFPTVTAGVAEFQAGERQSVMFEHNHQPPPIPQPLFQQRQPRG